jgi:hypothetical protein
LFGDIVYTLFGVVGNNRRTSHAMERRVYCVLASRVCYARSPGGS